MTVELHPHARAFVELTAGSPPLDEQDVDAAREQLRGVVPHTGAPAELADVRDATVPGPAGPIPIRHYRPSTAPGLPVVVYLHGGGWVLGDLDTHDATCRDLAAHSGAAVVAVHYRRAPEHRFPAALEDALAVTRHVARDAPAVAVAGDSAGGNLAAVVALELRGEVALAHQALVYPVTDARVGATGSYERFAEGHFLTRRDMRFFVDAYAPGVDPADPRLSPLAAPDLSGLPPASVVLAEADPLHDEGLAYAERLRAAGVPVDVRVFPGQVHPFVALAGIIEDGATARRWLAEHLRAAFAA
jgi:acetyl esterase